MKKEGILIIFLLLLFSQPKKVLAQAVINEVLPNPAGEDSAGEWVEIYNTSETALDISGYKLKDADNHELIIGADYTDGGTLVAGKSWLLIKRNNHSTFSLNNTGSEEVSLWDNAGSPSKIDSFSYSDSDENKSWGRIPDGGSIHGDKLVPTPNGANVILPTATPQPTVTLTPAPTSIPPTVTPTLTSVPAPNSYSNIYISELMAYPEGGNEWVELYNNNDYEVDLFGWFLDDIAGGGKSPRMISGKVGRKSYKQYYLDDFFLNNDGDDVRLLNGSQTEKDKKTFTNSRKGKSWSKDSGGNWCETDPTPDAANPVCSSPTSTPVLTLTPTATEIPTVTPGFITTPAEEEILAEPTSKKVTNDAEVLGAKIIPTKGSDLKSEGNKFKISAGIFIFAGLMLLGLSGFYLFRENKNKKIVSDFL